MALLPNSLYAYVNLTDAQVFIETGDMTDRGDWSSSVAYAVNDAVRYLGAHYICLTTNTNTPPSGNVSDEWSTLALIRQGPPDPVDDFIENGTRVIFNYHMAWGTNSGNNEISAADIPYNGSFATVGDALNDLLGSGGGGEALQTEIAARIFADGTVAQQGSNLAFELFQRGTDYTNSVAGSFAGAAGSEYAYNLFLAGTNYTDNRVSIVVQQGSQYSTILRDQGTNFALAHDTIVAQQGSQFSMIVHDQGTNYSNANDLIIAQQGSKFAYDLYVAGTNYTNAHASPGGSDYAFLLFIAGTNFAIARDAVVAQQGSQFSTIHRDQGTNYTDSRVSIIAQQGSQYATILRDQGTTFTTGQVAIEAAARAAADLVVSQQGSKFAYDLYVAGTNYTDAHAASAGSDYSLALFVAGTNFTIARDAVVAQQGSQFGVILRDQGTSYTNSQVAVEVVNRTAADLVVAQQGSQFTVIARDQGTNYANTRDLVVSQQGSQYAFGLYVAGTNYAASLSSGGAGTAIAQQGSQFTIIARDFGTNYTDSRFAVATQQGSQYATILRDQGTNYTDSRFSVVSVNGSNYVDSQMAAERSARVFGDGTVAQQGSNYSYALYVAGTNYAASLGGGGGSSGTTFSNTQGLQFSYTGSNLGPKDVGIYHSRDGGALAITDGGSAVGTYGGTNLARLAVKNIEMQGTTPNYPTSGTITIDFAGYAAQTVVMTSLTPLIINTANRQPDRSAMLRLIASGTDRGVQYPQQWVWLGSPAGPTSVLFNKTTIISVQCWGQTENDVTAMWTTQY